METFWFVWKSYSLSYFIVPMEICQVIWKLPSLSGNFLVHQWVRWVFSQTLPWRQFNGSGASRWSLISKKLLFCLSSIQTIFNAAPGMDPMGLTGNWWKRKIILIWSFSKYLHRMKGRLCCYFRPNYQVFAKKLSAYCKLRNHKVNAASSLCISKTSFI